MKKLLPKVLPITLVLVLLVGVMIYFAQPTFAWGFGVSAFVLPLLVAGVVILFLRGYNIETQGLFPAIAFLITFILQGFIFNSGALHSTSYQKLIGDVSTSEFTQTLEAIDVSQIRIVDQEFAMKLGAKKLGEDASLGSRAELDTMNIQSINGKLYWVGPILHSGFFKWLKFDDTPGYVKVSTTNPQDVEMILAYKLVYQPNAWFGDNLKRHIYFSGYMTTGLTDFSFEVDDNGKPYYVVTTYDKTIGFSGDQATGVLVVDPQTGNIAEYTTETAPAWVDRIQPEKFITFQLDNWGKYVHGWWNSMFAKDGVLTTTEGISLVYNNGKSYWYTGISSVGTDESTVGFALVDTRTKETVWYKVAGATEIAAKRSAEGQVQEKEYVASAPILYNIGGIPTYVMSLKDASGLVKLISMVSVEDYSIVAVGEDVRSTLRSYRSALTNRGNSIVPDVGSNDFITTTSQVERFAMDVRGNNSAYTFTVDEVNKIFTSTSGISSELPLTKAGDTVKISYMKTDSGVIDLVRFDNLNIDVSHSAEQVQSTTDFESVQQKKVDNRISLSLDDSWEDLSLEQKKEVLKK